MSRFIEREAHFPELFKRFETMQREQPGRLENLKFITSAKVSSCHLYQPLSKHYAKVHPGVQVPIISFFLDGIDIDIGFSQTNLTTLDSGDTRCFFY